MDKIEKKISLLLNTIYINQVRQPPRLCNFENCVRISRFVVECLVSVVKSMPAL